MLDKYMRNPYKVVKPNKLAARMKQLGDLARRRIVEWMDANPAITQTTVAKAVGVTQAWVSRYRAGFQDADIDQLAAMSAVFSHTLTELLDLRPDPKEQALVAAFRAIPAERRDLAVKMLEAMVMPPPRGHRK
jgi:predicted XRE-type DNA-binding protein